MRDAVIDRQFQHLRIDHDEFAAVGRHPVQDRQDHRVDADRFAGARRAGDQQMRHAREIGDDRLAADILAERQREPARMFLIGRRIEELAQIDRLGLQVGQFDADDGAAGHDRDAHRNRAHRAGDVVGEPDDARRLDAGRRLQLIERHDRAGAHLHDPAAHAEILEHGFQHARVLGERLLVDRFGAGGRRLRQQVQRRQDRLAVERQHRLRLLRRALSRRGRLRPRHDKAHEAPRHALRFLGFLRGDRRHEAELGFAPGRQWRDARIAACLSDGLAADDGLERGGLRPRLEHPPRRPPVLPHPPAKRRGGERAISRGARKPRRTASGAAADDAPIARRQTDDRQQQKGDERCRRHRHRQRQWRETHARDQPQQGPADRAAGAGRRPSGDLQHRAGERAQDQRRAQHREAPREAVHRPPKHQAKRPAEQHGRQQIGGKADALHQEIGDDCAVIAEIVARRRGDRGVERGVPREIGQQRQDQQEARQHQQRAQRLEHTVFDAAEDVAPEAHAAAKAAHRQLRRSGHSRLIPHPPAAQPSPEGRDPQASDTPIFLQHPANPFKGGAQGRLVMDDREPDIGLARIGPSRRRPRRIAARQHADRRVAP